MSQNSKARVAVVAAAALVGGLVPVLAATGASAITPTTVTVSPTATTVDVNGTARFTASANNDSIAAQLKYAIQSGPDAVTGEALKGIGGTAGAFILVNKGTAGFDKLVFFYDANNDNFFQPATEPSTNVTVTVAGTYTQAAVTPTTAKVATNSLAAYTFKGFDANGVPASGSLPFTISQTIPTATAPANNPLIVAADPTLATFPAVGTTGTTGSSPSGTNTTYTATGLFPLQAGAATYGVGSKVAGTVTITAGANTTTSSAGTATLAVSAGNTNSTPSIGNDNVAKGLTLSTPSSTSFTGKMVTTKVTVTNAAGDALGGVRVQGKVISGPSNAAAITETVTDQFGRADLTYTAASTAGTDSVQAWVNQDTNAVNTAGADAAEPQATGTVTLVAALTNPSLTTPVIPVKELTDVTTPVTFTLKAGSPQVAAANLTLNFALDATSVANKVTLSAASGVTDANGKATVTVTKPAAVSADITVTGTVNGDATVVAANSLITYAVSAAAKPTVTPLSTTLPAASTGSVINETVKILDNFGKPVANAAVDWSVTGRNYRSVNPTSFGSGSTNASGVYAFSYTDVGTGVGTDTVAITTASGNTSAAVNYVASSALTKTLILSPIKNIRGTSANPTATNPVTPLAITANASDESVVLANKAVTFSSTGVGNFTDAAGNVLPGTSVTARTDAVGNAVVFVRSAVIGTQTITATSDGVASNPASVTVDYTNDYVAVTPLRVVDTRIGQGALMPSNAVNPGLVAPNTLSTFNYSVAGLPAAVAYAFNVTAIGPNGVGNLRVGPGNAGVPETSLVNYQAGKDVANFVIVPNDGSGKLSVYSENSSVAVSIDLVGYYPETGIAPLNPPARLADTRTGAGPVAGGTSRSFQITGNGGVPLGATSVALNVTAITPSGVGNLRVYPDGGAVPTTSNVNYIVGQDKSAFVVVKLPANGKIAVYSDGGSADVAIDAFASYTDAANLVTSAPERILDTRTGTSLAANTPRSIPVTGKAGVPADAQAVLVSVTGIHNATSTGVGNLRVYPAGAILPVVSTLNYVSKSTDVANFAIVKLGANGEITLYSDGSPIDVAVDVLGYVPAGK
jgi:hypothetical protein